MKIITQPSKINLVLCFLLSFMFSSAINAQSQNVFYDSIKKQKFLIVDVHQTYERVLAKGYESVEMLEYLGNFYYKCQDYGKSKKYFDRLFKKYKVSQISGKSIEQYENLAACVIR